MHRNLICWSVVLVGYVLIVLWGNSQPVRIELDSDSAWGSFWASAESANIPLPEQVSEQARPQRPPPIPPPPEITRENAVEVIRYSICKAQAEKIVPLLGSCIRVSAVPVDDMRLIEPGASRYAAEADVPSDFAWPKHEGRPLRLLAQIRCSDFAAFDDARLLPNSGWLLFFYADGDPPPAGIDPQDSGAWRVVHIDGAPEDLQRRSPPANQEPQFPPSTLRFWREWTLPPSDELPPKIINRWNCDSGSYEDLRTALTGRPKEPACHRLLPRVEWPQLTAIAQLAAGGTPWSRDLGPGSAPLVTKLAGREQWLLLFELEYTAVRALSIIPNPQMEDVILPRGDPIYFMIRKTDLAARDFSRVWAIRPESIPRPTLDEEDVEDEEYFEESADDGAAPPSP